MNKFISLVALFIGIGFVGAAFSAEPVFRTRYNDGEYAVSQAAITISTDAVTTIAAKDGYRSITIQFAPTLAQEVAGSSIAFRMDGSTATIPATGFELVFSTSHGTSIPAKYEITLEGNAAINLQGCGTGTAGSDVAARYIEKAK